MNTYTFKTNKSLNTKKSSDNAKTYKSFLANNIASAYPWLVSEPAKPACTLCLYDPYVKDTSDYLAIALNKANNFDNYEYTVNTVNFNLENEFSKVLDALNLYSSNNYSMDLGYDFKDIFGEPVKIYDNFIQIGYEIIHTTPGYFNFLKPKQKKIIIDITIKTKKLGWF